MQETKELKPVLIEKELIPTLKFNNKDLVRQQEGLAVKLMEATKLGNLHHGKVAIIFEDDEGVKKVETTIWSTGTDYICLKGGVWLPINRIHRVVF
ncbi:MAG TPA: hypothetical protein VL021_01065 [Brumimicrobium sp.]|nr:hypothetical protein [Brumimicrobium sp.]